MVRANPVLELVHVCTVIVAPTGSLVPHTDLCQHVDTLARWYAGTPIRKQQLCHTDAAKAGSLGTGVRGFGGFDEFGL
jgi:hypothetical protein